MTPQHTREAIALFLSPPLHTGIAASWCPVCGTCTCPWEHGEPNRGGDPRCPLHGDARAHSKGDGPALR